MIPTDVRVYSVNNHAAHAFKLMRELRQKRELCDIALYVDRHEFLAHKVVLAGCSPYLRAMFTNGMLETEKNKVVIHGIEPATMGLLLDFMYTGSIGLTVDNVQYVLQGASMLNISSLRSICSQFLHLHLDAGNCLGIQSLADMFSCTQLEQAARCYTYQHFQDIVQHDEFFQISENKLVELLKSDQLQVEKEKCVFEAALSWIEYDYDTRSSSVCRILSCIRLALLDVPYLEDIVLQLDLVRNCPKCQHLVAKAMQIKNDNNALALVNSRALPPCVYVVGGRNSVDCQLKSVERYDILRDQWFSMENMLTARTAVGSATLTGRLYSVGGECALTDGHDNTLFLRNLECYDPVQKEWLARASMKIARSFVSVAACGGYLYAIGGEDRSSSYNVVERYDQKHDTWTFVSSMQKKRSGAGVAVCDSRIYIAGGFDKDFHADRASVECFDPDTQEWTLVAEMEKARSGLVLVSVEHWIYAIGGRSRHNDQYFDLIERYNTITRQWTTVSSMQVPRAWPSAAMFENKIFVMGGFDGTSRLRSVECYDPQTDTWSFLSNMNVNRAGCGASVV